MVRACLFGIEHMAPKMMAIEGVYTLAANVHPAICLRLLRNLALPIQIDKLTRQLFTSTARHVPEPGALANDARSITTTDLRSPSAHHARDLPARQHPPRLSRSTSHSRLGWDADDSATRPELPVHQLAPQSKSESRCASTEPGVHGYIEQVPAFEWLARAGRRALYHVLGYAVARCAYE